MNVYTANQIHQLDQQAEQQGFNIFALMENAGRGIAEALKTRVKKREHILMLAGRGNNGGDGIVAARYLQKAGYTVSLTFPLGLPKTETASAHLAYYEQQNFTAMDWEEGMQPDVIVDALLGVGAKPPLRENAAKIVGRANEEPARRYAIDIPTGVQADSGEVIKTTTTTAKDTHAQAVTAFKAEETFSLHGAKPSAFLLPANHYYGKVTSIDIGLKQGSDIRQTSVADVRDTLPSRKTASHKGTFGTSLVVAGSDDMPGSALLAAIGAIRSGTGRLVLATTRFAASIITTSVPEATYLLNGLEKVGEGEWPAKTHAIGIGPGLSNKHLINRALDKIMATDIPLVIDAGALLPERAWQRDATTILTPHPGEFSLLTGMSIADIQANRITVAQDFAQKNDVILVLKGTSTVIAFPDGTARLNPTGNSGLAKGGSGDVLTGMITSMLSFYDNPKAAVTNAVYIHGLCAEWWKESNSEASMTASDFALILPKVLKDLEE